MIHQNGFIKKSFYEIKQDLETKAKQYFGSDMNFSAGSDLGFFTSEISYLIASLWEEIEGLYLSQDISSAKGVWLDRLVFLRGIKRLSETATKVSLLLEGEVGSQVPKNFFVSKEDTEEMFTNKESLKLDYKECYQISLKIQEKREKQKVYLNLNETLITYQLKSNETCQSIFESLKQLFEMNNLPYILSLVDQNILIRSKEEKNQISLSDYSSDTLAIEEVGVLQDFYSLKIGKIFIPVGSLNQIKNTSQVYGLKRVHNPFPAFIGRERESDSELRERLFKASVQGLATDTAIENQILQVEGVTLAQCYSNRSSQKDSEGREPHSFEVIVVGGKDEEVAQKIFDSQPAGIVTYGNTAITLTSPQGFFEKSLIIHFSRAEKVFVAISLTIEPLKDKSELPSNYEYLIKKALLSFSSKELSLGSPLILQKLLYPIYQSCEGIGKLKIEASKVCDGEDFPSALLQENISIAKREIIALRESYIQVKLQ